MEGPDPLSDADREFLLAVAARAKAGKEREAAAIERRLAEARAEARAIAMRIAADPRTQRVLLFGSAATGRRFRLDSDIDLAVEGGDILSHRARVEGSTFEVDVVDLTALPGTFRDSAELEGEWLYAKRD